MVRRSFRLVMHMTIISEVTNRRVKCVQKILIFWYFKLNSLTILLYSYSRRRWCLSFGVANHMKWLRHVILCNRSYSRNRMQYINLLLQLSQDFYAAICSWLGNNAFLLSNFKLQTLFKIQNLSLNQIDHNCDLTLRSSITSLWIFLKSLMLKDIMYVQCYRLFHCQIIDLN